MTQKNTSKSQYIIVCGAEEQSQKSCSCAALATPMAEAQRIPFTSPPFPSKF